MNKQERRRIARENDPAVQARKAQKIGLAALPGAGPISPGSPIATGGMVPTGSTGATAPGSSTGGGWGLGEPGAKPAGGSRPAVNPYLIPKAAGLTHTSQTFPSNFYVEWTPATWRYACDQATKMGQCIGIGALYDWVFQCSPFVQSMYTTIAAPLHSIKQFCVNKKGEKMDDWTTELTEKQWQKDMDEEILFSWMDGFAGINFDPLKGAIYTYPMPEVDPINRLLKAGTYDFYNGTRFEDTDNLLFVQRSQSQKRFLGPMQAIARAFILMNTNDSSWVQAGRRLAFPLMTVGYPQDDAAYDPLSGDQLNPYKVQAEKIIMEADPSKGLAYPYSIDERGNIIKALEVGFEKPGTSAKAHDIFVDFNEAKKNEIREMILGGTLTADVGNSGSRALGEVQERKFEAQMAANLSWVLHVKNNLFLPKLRKFYRNMPADLQFSMQMEKPMTLADMQALSSTVTQNGLKLNKKFFVANGIQEDFLDEAPDPLAATQPGEPGKDKNIKPHQKDFNMAGPARSLFGYTLKKKY